MELAIIKFSRAGWGKEKYEGSCPVPGILKKTFQVILRSGFLRALTQTQNLFIS